MQRNVLFDSYARTAESDWTGFIGTASIGGGYEWSGGCVKFGPLAGLDYGYLFRPDIVENGGARLVLDQANYNSLRSAVGGQVRATTKWKDMLVQAGLKAQWMHELLDNKSTLTAAFVGYESYKFDTFLQSGRDSLAVQGDLSFLLTETTRITGFVSTELFREQYIGFMGGFMFNWEF
jgi:outer membrane autotransporter protein